MFVFFSKSTCNWSHISCFVCYQLSFCLCLYWASWGLSRARLSRHPVLSWCWNGGCGREKLSDPISAVLKQEVHFQNIEHMANGCQQLGFHSFYHRKSWNTLDLLQIICWMVWITTLHICCPTRGLFVGMSIQNHAPIRFLNYSIWNDSFTVNRS